MLSFVSDPVIAPSVPAFEPAAVYAMPATQGQIRFWSLDQLVPGNPALNMPLMWECKGPLEIDRLTSAFRLAVARHESLRTTFASIDGKLMQMIAEEAGPLSIPVVSLEDVADAAESEEAGKLIRDHAAWRFDLRKGPLLVLELLQYTATYHVLLVTMHHIICDGISLGVLLRDLAELYRGLEEGMAAVLPEMPVQFADFALFEQEWRAGEEREHSLQYWRDSLGTGFRKVELRRDPELRSEGSAGRNDSRDGNIETFLLSADLTRRAHAFCVRENVTFNILLTSVFAAWLYGLTGQRDLLIGSPCANRTEETAELIGLFMNIQVLRARLPEGTTFTGLLHEIKTWAIGAYEHQQLPFEDLVHDPFFSEGDSHFELPIFFLYQKSFMVTQTIGELRIDPVRSMSPGAAFEFMFAIVDRDWEGPRLQLEYNPAHFRRETIQHYLTAYSGLLDAAIEDPDTLVETLAPVSALRAKVAAWEDSSPTVADEEYVAPRDPMERQLAVLWQTTLGIPRISVRASYFSLGSGSLAALRLITKINRMFALDLGLASLVAAPSIEALARVVTNRRSPNNDSTLVPIRTSGGRPPLFIVHGVGGNVVSFYGLAMRLGEDQPVYAIQAQSLLARRPALLHMEDLASWYLRDVRRVQPEGPYHFLGYSYGGTVAMEMTRQLRAAGQKVDLLAMLDAKSHAYRESLASATPMQAKIGGRMQQMAGNTGRLPWPERAAYIGEKLRTRSIRLSCKLAAMAGLRQVPAFLRSPTDINSLAARNYPMKPLDMTMVLFRAEEQDHCGAAHDLGWGAWFTGGVAVRQLPGDHERIFLEPAIQVLASGLSECLHACQTIRR